MQPLLLMFVFTYVFPKIGQGVGGAAAARRRSPARSWPASSAWPSSSRASRPWPCRWCRSSATPRRSRTGCWRRCRRRLVGVQKIVTGVLQRADRRRCSCSRSPTSCRPRPCTSTSTGSIAADAGPARRLGGRRPRARARHEGRAAAGVVPVRPRRAAADVPRRIYYPWKALEAVPLAAGRRARQPARVHVRGLPRRPDERHAAHEPVGRVRRADRCSPSCSPGSASTASSGAP